MNRTINFTLNGEPVAAEIASHQNLVEVLQQRFDLFGARESCAQGLCGCCTVLIKGRPVRSCITPVSSVAGSDIMTLEGLGSVEKPHAIQKAFVDEQAMQCGFCLSGVILTAKAALDLNPKATDAQLRQALTSVLCRCGTHTRMLKAIKRYAQEVRA